MIKLITTVTAVLNLFLVGCASTAFAETDDSSFSLSVGAFLTDRNSKARVDSTNGDRGTEVDLEDDLGLDNSDTVVDADFDLAIYKMAYTWLFLKEERGFLGATAGLYVADVGARLSATSDGSFEVSTATAPLPVFGLRGEYKFAEKWAMQASGELFFLEYDDFDGLLFDIFVGLDFDISKKVAVGVGVNSVRMDIGIAQDDLNGDLDWEYDGVLAYLKFDF